MLLLYVNDAAVPVNQREKWTSYRLESGQSESTALVAGERARDVSFCERFVLEDREINKARGESVYLIVLQVATETLSCMHFSLLGLDSEMDLFGHRKARKCG